MATNTATNTAANMAANMASAITGITPSPTNGITPQIQNPFPEHPFFVEYYSDLPSLLIDESLYGNEERIVNWLVSNSIEHAYPPVKKKGGGKIPLGPIIDGRSDEDKRRIVFWWRGMSTSDQKECREFLKCYYETYTVANKPRKSESQTKLKRNLMSSQSTVARDVVNNAARNEVIVVGLADERVLRDQLMKSTRSGSVLAYKNQGRKKSDRIRRVEHIFDKRTRKSQHIAEKKVLEANDVSNCKVDPSIHDTAVASLGMIHFRTVGTPPIKGKYGKKNPLLKERPEMTIMIGPNFPSDFGELMQQTFGEKYEVKICNPEDTPPMERLIKKRRLPRYRDINEIRKETESDIARGITTRHIIQHRETHGVETSGVARRLFL